MFIVFLLAALAASDDSAWPIPKSTIYISATLTHVRAPSVWTVTMSAPMHPVIDSLPACIPIRVGKVKAKKARFYASDNANGMHRFLGQWSPRIHPTESECESYLSAHGEPKIINSYDAILNMPLVEHHFISERANTPQESPPPNP